MQVLKLIYIFVDGFRKIVGVDHGGLKIEKDDMEFSHPHFIQGHADQLDQIKRKVSGTKYSLFWRLNLKQTLSL